jgi:hypothetical protein
VGGGRRGVIGIVRFMIVIVVMGGGRQGATGVVRFMIVIVMATDEK